MLSGSPVRGTQSERKEYAGSMTVSATSTASDFYGLCVCQRCLSNAYYLLL